MGMTNTERVTLHRQRKRVGQRPVTVIVSEQEIDFLLAHDYELARSSATGTKTSTTRLAIRKGVPIPRSLGRGKGLDLSSEHALAQPPLVPAQAGIQS